MLMITQESLRECAAFVNDFINVHYTGSELAKLLDTSMTVISFKRNCVRWTLREIETIFENKGFQVSYEIGHNLNSSLLKKPTPAVAAGPGGPATKYDCKRLRFIQDYIARYNINYQTLIDTGHYMLLNKSLNRDDIRFSYLLSFVSRLNAELRVDVSQCKKAVRPRSSGVVIVACSAINFSQIVTEDQDEEPEKD